MKYNADYIDRALYLSHRSRFKGYGTGAVIVWKNEIVSEGWSHMSDIRLNELWSMHAEIHALGRARHLILDNAHIYVATRRATNGNVTLSKPCLTCAIALESVGVTTAYYTMGTQTHGTRSFDTKCLYLDDDLKDLKVYTKYDN